MADPVIPEEDEGMSFHGEDPYPFGRMPPRDLCLAHIEREPCQTCAAYIAAGL